VGFWHRDTGAGLASWLSSELGEHVGIVDGGTLQRDANAVITKFRDGNMRVLCGQIATMGEAHNLQNCHRVVLAEQSWVPGQNKQFIARCHRQGQKNRVIVNSVSIKGSLDENVTRSLTRKISDQEESMS
jgi:SNF2 family DNA or RNA helicase